KKRPLTLYLTREADDYLEAFEQEIEPQLAETGELGNMTDWAGKLAGAALRLSGLLHLAECSYSFTPFPSQVSAETMKRAIAIGRYLIPHAQAAYAEMGADPEIEAARYVLRWIFKWIESGKELKFQKQKAWQGTKGRFKKVADLDKALALLIEHSFVRQGVADRRKGPGRKPGGIFEINPLVTSYNSYNSYNSDSEMDSRNSRNEHKEHGFEPIHSKPAFADKEVF
ncbi:MAG: DUF3987 domain-containing protein, partial [Acidobacteriales bacterium]|nr:DUF3987 domain-containing protein [Terriglobales bacterium]